MSKKKQSTLEGMDSVLTRTRADGNTIRLVDNAIQILYSNKICVVRDHSGFGENKTCNIHLFDAILSRLHNEHRLLQLRAENKIRIDKGKLEIELL